MLSDMELLLGLSRHLATYATSPAKAALEQIAGAGQVFDMAFRLKGSGTSSPARVSAIGIDAHLGQRDLKFVLEVLVGLGWVDIQRAPDSTAIAVVEVIPQPTVLMASASKILGVLGATTAELAALAVLRATTLQPLVLTEAVEVGALAEGITGVPAGEEAAEQAIRHLTAVGLVQSALTDADDRQVIFNPNVWTSSPDLANAALRAADARATGEVTALIEEVAHSPGMPEAHVTSTEKKWVDFAVSQGLIQRSVVQTSEDVEQGFLFTPHLSRDPFGAAVKDASGQVRQLVGSMIYATVFPKIKLNYPATFIRRLISEGVAGDATPIGTDYPMLEKAGIVRVLPGSTQRKFRLELLQPDIAESALQVLQDRDQTGGGTAEAAAFRAQKGYIHVDAERARLAISGPADDVEQQRLIAALRETTSRGGYGSR